LAFCVDSLQKDGVDFLFVKYPTLSPSYVKALVFSNKYLSCPSLISIPSEFSLVDHIFYGRGVNQSFTMISFFLVLPLLAHIVYGAPQGDFARARGLVKRDAPPPSSATKVSGSVVAKWNNGVEILAAIEVGGTTLMTLLDTGSGDV